MNYVSYISKDFQKKRRNSISRNSTIFQIRLIITLKTLIPVVLNLFLLTYTVLQTKLRQIKYVLGDLKTTIYLETRSF